MSANNINAFALSCDESVLFGGTKSGQLLAIDPVTLEVTAEVQSHYGSIEVVAVHPKLPVVGMYGKDRNISLFDVSTPRSPKLMQTISLRNISPNDDPAIGLFPSTNQVFTFHDTEPRFAGHSGNGGLVEMTFSDNSAELIHCSRVHGNYDYVTARYVPGTNKLLTGTVRGLVYLSENGKTLKTWDFGQHNNRQALHWFEPLPDGSFLIASDGQQIFRFDPEERTPTIYGTMFVRDHLEHVTYHHGSGKAYCTGFDRTVHEISLEDCSSKGIIWESPFKLRWVRRLETNPDIMLVNCRNGGLYQVSVEKKATTRVLKTTPDALWSATAGEHALYVFGEGAKVTKMAPGGVEKDLRANKFIVTEKQFAENDKFYTKRAISSRDGRHTYFGRTDGSVWSLSNDEVQKMTTLTAAVRDMDVDGDHHLYVSTEDGILHCIDLTNNQVSEIYRAPTPLWALAHHPGRPLLAAGHRTDGVVLINTETGAIQPIAVGTRFCKRVRWLDDDTLLIGNSGDLVKYSLRLKSSQVLVSNLPNTIEDFDWTEDRQYLVIVVYSRYLYLVDLTTGVMLGEYGHEMDYGKGVFFIPKHVSQTEYPGDFIAFGRDGLVRQFRIHDDRIIPLDHIPST